MTIKLRRSGLAGLLCVMLILATVLPQPAAVMAWPGQSTRSTPICTASGDQEFHQLIPDGSGGAIIAWSEWNGFSINLIHAQRLSAAGAPHWMADGVAVGPAAGDQNLPALASDGAGGAIIAWVDEREAWAKIYAQRVNGAGAAQWAAEGVPVCSPINWTGTQP